MPFYEYTCPAEHRETRLRSITRRHDPLTCSTCGGEMALTISRPSGSPDGIYSYAPNIGDPERFERQRHAIKTGQKVIPREQKMNPEHRDGQLSSRRA